MPYVNHTWSKNVPNVAYKTRTGDMYKQRFPRFNRNTRGAFTRTWRAKNAVGDARRQQAMWRNTYYRKHGRKAI